MYKQNIPLYPSVTYSQPSLQDQLDQLRQTTDELAAVTRYVGVRKELNKIQDETARHNELHNKVAWLSNQPIVPLLCSPMYTIDIDWDIVPSDLREIVHNTSLATGWPPLAVLMNFLGCINAAMRGRYIIQPDNSWQEPPLLYITLFAESGTKKSQLVNLGKRPLLDFEQHVKQQYNEQDQKQIITAKAYKLAQDYQIKSIVTQAAKTHIGNNHSFFEEVIDKAENLACITKKHSAEKTYPPGVFANSCTDKALLNTMYMRGGGQSIIEPEGNKILSQMKDPRFDIDIILKSYGMENYTHCTTTGKEVYLNNPFLNILLVAQPDIAAQIYGNERFNNTGLTPRFLPYFVPFIQSQAEVVNGTICRSMEEYNRKITAMLERNYTQSQNQNLLTIQVDAEAYETIKAFQEEISNRLIQNTTMSNPFMAFTRKIHGTAVRIAGVLHAWRYEKPEDHPISIHDMQAGILIAREISAHAAYATDPTGLCAYGNAQKILKWANRHRHAQFTSRDIAQNSGVKTNDKIFPAVDLLEHHNILTQVVTPNHPRLCQMHPCFNYNN